MTDAEASAEALAFWDANQAATPSPTPTISVDQDSLDKLSKAEADDFFDKHEEKRVGLLQQQAEARADRTRLNPYKVLAAPEMALDRAWPALEGVGQGLREMYQGSPIPPEEQAGTRLRKMSQEARDLYADPLATPDQARTKGFLETVATTSPTDIIPFASSIIDTQQATDLYMSSKRLAAGTPEPGDVERVQWANDQAQRDPTIPARIFSLVKDQPAFWGELATGAGTYRAGKMAFDQLLGTATKAAQKYSVGRGAVAAVRAGAASALALPQTSAPRIAAEAVGRMTPTIDIGQDAQGEPVINVTRGGESWAEAVPRAVLSQWDEILTERSGLLFEKAGQKLGIVLAKPQIQAVINRIPGTAKARLLATTVEEWLAKNPTSSVGEALKAVTSKAAYHGPLGETFEEHVSDVLKPVLMQMTGSDRPEETQPSLWPGWREELIRLAAFSVPGAAASVANRVGNVADRYSADAEENARRQGPAWQRIVDEEARGKFDPQNAQRTLATAAPGEPLTITQNMVTAPNVGQEVPRTDIRFDRNAISGLDTAVVPSGRTPIDIAIEATRKPYPGMLRSVAEQGLTQSGDGETSMSPVDAYIQAQAEAVAKKLEAQRINEEARRAKREGRPVVPGTPVESDAMPVLAEIRAYGAHTIDQIKQVFDRAQLTDAQAEELRLAAWGPQAPMITQQQAEAGIVQPPNAAWNAGPVDSFIAARIRAATGQPAARPVVPATTTQENVPVLAEIKRAGARTPEAVQELFPAARLTRDAASNLASAAWGPNLQAELEAEAEAKSQSDITSPRVGYVKRSGARTVPEIQRAIFNGFGVNINKTEARAIKDEAWGGSVTPEASPQPAPQPATRPAATTAQVLGKAAPASKPTPVQAPTPSPAPVAPPVAEKPTVFQTPPEAAQAPLPSPPLFRGEGKNIGWSGVPNVEWWSESEDVASGFGTPVEGAVSKDAKVLRLRNPPGSKEYQNELGWNELERIARKYNIPFNKEIAKTAIGEDLFAGNVIYRERNEQEKQSDIYPTTPGSELIAAIKKEGYQVVHTDMLDGEGTMILDPKAIARKSISKPTQQLEQQVAPASQPTITVFRGRQIGQPNAGYFWWTSKPEMAQAFASAKKGGKAIGEVIESKLDPSKVVDTGMDVTGYISIADLSKKLGVDEGEFRGRLGKSSNAVQQSIAGNMGPIRLHILLESDALRSILRERGVVAVKALEKYKKSGEMADTYLEIVPSSSSVAASQDPTTSRPSKAVAQRARRLLAKDKGGVQAKATVATAATPTQAAATQAPAAAAAPDEAALRAELEAEQAANPVPGVDLSVESFESETWTPEFMQAAQNAGWTAKEAEGAIGLIRGVSEVFKANAAFLPNAGMLDKDGKPIKAVVDNQDFVRSIDINKICKRSRQFYATIKKIQMAIGRPMSEDELLRLGQQMRKDGDIPFCIACYVEAARRAGARNAHLFVTTTQDNISARGGTEHLRELITQRDQLLNELGWSHEDLGRFVVDEKANAPYRKSDTPQGELWRIYANYILNAKGATLSENGTYDHELLKLTPQDVADMNERAGLRMFSSTDLDPTQLVDLMQILADMTVKGMSAHAYTKDPYTVLILGESGIKINMSIAYVWNGHTFVSDNVNGMPLDIALKLRDMYPNAGTIFLGKNLKQLEFGLSDQNVDQIIPHHAANWSDKREKIGIFDLDDFADVQKEHWTADAKVPSITVEKKGKPVTHKASPQEWFGNKLWFSYWMQQTGNNERAAVAAYLAFCAENKITPKFDKGMYTSGETKRREVFPGYTKHPGYAKLLKDYARYDTPQTPVDITKVNGQRMHEWLNKFVAQRGWAWRAEANPKTVDAMVRLLKSEEGLDLAGTEAELKANPPVMSHLDTLESLGLAGNIVPYQQPISIQEALGAPGRAPVAAWQAPSISNVEGAVDATNADRRSQSELLDVARRAVAAALPGRPGVSNMRIASRQEIGTRSELGADTERLMRELFGLRVVFFAGTDSISGFSLDAIPGVVFVNVNTGRPVMTVAGHELLHQMRATRPDLYATLLSAVQGLITNFSDYKASRAALGYNATDDAKMREELLADFVGDNFVNPEFWKRLATQLEAQRPGFWRQLGRSISNWLFRISQWLTGNGYGSSKYFSDVQAAQSAVIDALAAYKFDPASDSNVTDGIDFMTAPEVSPGSSVDLSQTPLGQQLRATARCIGGNFAAIGHAIQAFKNLPQVVQDALDEVGARIDILESKEAFRKKIGGLPVDTRGTLMQFSQRSATFNGLVDNDDLSMYLAEAAANMMLLRDSMDEVVQRAVDAAATLKKVEAEEDARTFKEKTLRVAKMLRGRRIKDLQIEHDRALNANNSTLAAAINKAIVDMPEADPTFMELVRAMLDPDPAGPGMDNAFLSAAGLTSADVQTWFVNNEAKLKAPASKETRAEFANMLGSNPKTVNMLKAIRFRQPTADQKSAREQQAATADAEIFLRNLLDAPEFKQNLKEVTEKLNIHEITGKTSEREQPTFVNPWDPSKFVQIDLMAQTAKQHAANQQAIDVALGWYRDYLDPAKTPNPAPERAASYKRAIAGLEAMGDQTADPANNKLLYDTRWFYNAGLALSRAIGTGNGDIPEALIPFVSGPMRIRLAMGIMAYSEIKARVNEATQANALNAQIATYKAAKAHGMSVDTWSKVIGASLFWSRQNQDTSHLARGESWEGYRITQLDWDAVVAQKKFDDALIGAAKGAEELTTYNAAHPAATRDVLGKTLVFRDALSTGMTVPQVIRAREVNAFVSKWDTIEQLRKGGRITDDDADAQFLSLLSENAWFKMAVVSHLESFSNPRYRKRAASPWDGAYSTVVQDWHANGNVPHSMDDLAQRIYDEAIKANTGKGVVPADTDDVKAQLLAEIKRAVNAYTADENKSLKAFEADVEVSTRDKVAGSHSFMDRPRGEQILPMGFYTYDSGSQEGQNRLIKAVLDIPAMRHLNNLKLLENALQQAVNDMEVGNDTPDQKQKTSRVLQLSGKQALNLREAQGLFSKTKTYRAQFELYIEKTQVEDNLVTKGVNVTRGVIAWALLQKVATMLANSAGHIINRQRMDLMMRSGNGWLYNVPIVGPLAQLLYSTARAVQIQTSQAVFNHALASLDMYSDRSPKLKAVLLGLRANRSFWVQWLRRAAIHMQRQRERLELGQRLGVVNTTQSLLAIKGAVNFPLGGGESRLEPKNKAMGAARSIMTLIQNIGIPLGVPLKFASGLVDNMSNAAAWGTTDDVRDRLERWALKSLRAQQAAGIYVQKLRPDRDRVSSAMLFGRAKARESDAIYLRNMMSMAGINIERKFIEYWQAVDKAEKAGANDISGIRMLNDLEHNSLYVEVAKRLNAAMFANRPFYNSSWAKVFSLFYGYSQNEGRQFSEFMARPSHDKRAFDPNLWVNMFMMMLGVLIAGSVLTFPLAQFIHWFLYGERMPVKNLSQATGPGDLLMTSIAQSARSIPMLGNLMLNTMGSGNPGTSIGGFGLQFVPLSLFNNVKNTVSKAVQTGDWEGPMMNLTRQYFPNSRIWSNQLPSREGYVNESNLANDYRQFASAAGVDVKAYGQSGGGMQRFSVASGEADVASNALSSDAGPDMETVAWARSRGAAKLSKAHGITPEAAAKRFDRMVMARNAQTSVFGRELTADEMAQVTSRMSPEQLANKARVEGGRKAYAAAYGLTEPDFIKAPPKSAQGTAVAGGLAGYRRASGGNSRSRLRGGRSLMGRSRRLGLGGSLARSRRRSSSSLLARYRRRGAAAAMAV